MENTADTQIPLDEEIASDREGRNAAISNLGVIGKYSSGQFRNEETAYNTGRNVAEPENDTIIDTNLKDEEIASNSEGRNDSNSGVIGKCNSGRSADEHIEKCGSDWLKGKILKNLVVHVPDFNEATFNH